MSNAILFVCYGKSHIVVLITKHTDTNKSIYDKIAHQQLNSHYSWWKKDILKILKNIGSKNQNSLTANETQLKTK